MTLLLPGFVNTTAQGLQQLRGYVPLGAQQIQGIIQAILTSAGDACARTSCLCSADKPSYKARTSRMTEQPFTRLQLAVEGQQIQGCQAISSSVFKASSPRGSSVNADKAWLTARLRSISTYRFSSLWELSRSNPFTLMRVMRTPGAPGDLMRCRLTMIWVQADAASGKHICKIQAQFVLCWLNVPNKAPVCQSFDGQLLHQISKRPWANSALALKPAVDPELLAFPGN